MAALTRKEIERTAERYLLRVWKSEGKTVFSGEYRRLAIKHLADFAKPLLQAARRKGTFEVQRVLR